MNNTINTKLISSLGFTMLITGAPAALVSHYKFDEASGASTAVNEVVGGAGYDASVVGFVATGLSGVAGNAYQFDGNGANHVILDNPAFASAISTSQELTFSAWIKTSNGSGSTGIVGLGNKTTNDQYYQLSTEGPEPRIVNRSATFHAYESLQSINDDSWHHLVGTIRYDGTDTHLELYIDGVFDGGTILTLDPPPNALNVMNIGVLARTNGGSPQFADSYTGLIDDVQIYDEVLSASQISYLYNNAGQAIPEPSVAVLSLGVLGLLARRRR
ncbi:MAG: LamG domain-containing protein [Verrucomicrobiales bacterium]